MDPDEFFDALNRVLPYIGLYDSGMTIDAQSRISVPKHLRTIIIRRSQAIKETYGIEPLLYIDVASGDTEDMSEEGSSGTKLLIPHIIATDIPCSLKRPLNPSDEYLAAHELDTQGRVTLGERVRESAGLVEKVICVGAVNHFRIYDMGKWQEYMRSQKST